MINVLVPIVDRLTEYEKMIEKIALDKDATIFVGALEEFKDKLNFKDCILTNILKHEDNRPRAVIGYCQYYSKPYYAQFDNGTIVLTCDGDSYNINAKASLYKNAWWNRNYTGNWYWFKSDGKYAKNESIKIGEKTYNFDSTGLCTNS